MQRTRVKICGITRPEDGFAAARCGADAIGLVFYAPSPRHVSIAQARAVVQVLPPFVTVVGLFVNAAQQEITDVLQQLRLDVLQFHGNETPEECARFGLPYLKALRVTPTTDITRAASTYATAQGLLLDAHVEGVPGGTGQTFDWNLVPRDLPTAKDGGSAENAGAIFPPMPLILAGGLSPLNVKQAIRTARPYGVDVSGGVEAAKGIKDAAKIAAFMNEVAGAST